MPSEEEYENLAQDDDFFKNEKDMMDKNLTYEEYDE